MDKIKTKLPNSAMLGVDKEFNTNHFFFEHNCFLKDYKVNNTEVSMMSGDYINRQCGAYNINQRIILMTLQREQGLISKSDISQIVSYKRPDGVVVDSMTGACGVGLYDTKTLSKFMGFDNQIKWACATYRNWFDAFKPGVEMELLDKDPTGKYLKVIPESAIVFSLLKYTPHLGVIDLSEKIFYEFFDGKEWW